MWMMDRNKQPCGGKQKKTTLNFSSPINFTVYSIVLSFAGLFVTMKGSKNQTVTEKIWLCLNICQIQGNELCNLTSSKDQMTRRLHSHEALWMKMNIFIYWDTQQDS